MVLLDLFTTAVFETLTSRLHPLLLLKVVNIGVLGAFVTHQCSWGHFRRITNNEIVDVVVIDDVGYVASSLVHVAAVSTG